jgi:predicted RNA-binding Zn-ribbon protein involved in translation (DUF1610 family)
MTYKSSHVGYGGIDVDLRNLRCGKCGSKIKDSNTSFWQSETYVCPKCKEQRIHVNFGILRNNELEQIKKDRGTNK